MMPQVATGSATVHWGGAVVLPTRAPSTPRARRPRVQASLTSWRASTE